MKIKEIDKETFEKFAHNHPLKSHYQTYNYAMLMTNYYFEYDLIGGFDKNGLLVAASVILTKLITKTKKYGYAPKGFLLDYNDENLVKTFTKELKKYYRRRGLVLIKINPDIIIGEALKENNYSTTYNDNLKIVDSLKKYGYLKLKNNLYFESQFPRFNAIVNLQEFKGLSSVKKNVRNKVRKCEKNGLTLIKGEATDIETFYDFIKNKKKRNINYYKDYYNTFAKDNMMDLFLVKVNFTELLSVAQEEYNREIEINEQLNELLQQNQNEKILTFKMQSDRKIESLKNEIILGSREFSTNLEDVIAGALVLKMDNKVNILICGYDLKYKRLNPNYFLHYKIIEEYAKESNKYQFLDLDGITGDFTLNNPYYGLNQFKMSFKPNIYEHIGEFDLIIKKRAYKQLEYNNDLVREFNKPWVKKGETIKETVQEDIIDTTQNIEDDF